jgi:hypothetical protein
MDRIPSLDRLLCTLTCKTSQATANILLLRRLSNPDHPVLHDGHDMRPIRRPATTMKDSSPDRRPLRPILFTEPIALRITALTFHRRLEQQMFNWRMESHSMRQTPHLTIRAPNFQVVRNIEQTIPIGSVQVRADVQVRIVGWHVPYRPVENQLPAVERLAMFVESLHIRFRRLQAWEFVVGLALLEFLSIPWNVHPGCFGEVGGGFVLKDGAVGSPEVHRSLRVEGAVLVGFEGAGAGEADSFACGLGYVYDPCAVRAAVADGVDFVDEGDVGEAGQDEPAGYVL